MDPITGTLVVFSFMLLAFFGLPMAGLFIMSAFFPANISPLSTPIGINTAMNLDQESIGFPIHVRKVRNKGHIIWVDAVEMVPA